MAKEKLEILCPYIILCEGMDLKSFMINYLGFLCKKDDFYESFQAVDFGGVNDLDRQLKVLQKLPDFSIVRAILIIRDAEQDYTRAKKDIERALSRNGVILPEKPGHIAILNDSVKITYLLLPALDENTEQSGTLENLCLDIANVDNREAVLGKIEDYLNVLQNDFHMTFPRIHKNKMHLLISSYDKYVDAKIGEAGQRGMYDFESHRLEYLRKTLVGLAD